MTDTIFSPASAGSVDPPPKQRVVLKFGGSSVRDADAIRRLTEIVRREDRGQLVVVSALAAVTDQLVDLASRATAGEQPALGEIIDDIQNRHLQLASEMVAPAAQGAVTSAIDDTCLELKAMVHAVAVLHDLSPRSFDAIASFGEILSSRLVAACLVSEGLAAEWVDARRVLVTDGSYGRAQPDIATTTSRVQDAVAPLIRAGVIPVLGGFVGATLDGVTTTLGRCGSDYSAAIFGAALDVCEIQIWTDVDGMLTADPRIVRDARLVPRLTFGEASELAYFGAKVLHPASIRPAVAKNIPVRIVNARRPDGHGSEITARSDGNGSPIAALASKRNLTVIEIASARMLMAHGFLKQLFDVFDRFETAVDVVTTSEVDVSVTIDDPTHVDALVAALSEFADVTTEPEMALLCVVGERLHDDPALFAEIVSALGSVPCRMVSQSASRRNLTFVLRERELPVAMTRLHDHFFAHVEA